MPDRGESEPLALRCSDWLEDGYADFPKDAVAGCYRYDQAALFSLDTEAMGGPLAFLQGAWITVGQDRAVWARGRIGGVPYSVDAGSRLLVYQEQQWGPASPADGLLSTLRDERCAEWLAHGFTELTSQAAEGEYLFTEAVLSDLRPWDHHFEREVRLLVQHGSAVKVFDGLPWVADSHTRVLAKAPSGIEGARVSDGKRLVDLVRLLRQQWRNSGGLIHT